MLDWALFSTSLHPPCLLGVSFCLLLLAQNRAAIKKSNKIFELGISINIKISIMINNNVKETCFKLKSAPVCGHLILGLHFESRLGSSRSPYPHRNICVQLHTESAMLLWP